ncbi:MAG: ABC transporter substrate-binding protein [Sneathiella sp.]
MHRTQLLLLLGFLLWPATSHAEPDNHITQAHDLIQSLVDRAPVILRPSNKSLENREQVLQKELGQHIDFALMASVVMGRYWKTMEAAQKNDFFDLFSDFFLNSYTPLLGGYPGDKLEVRYSRNNGSQDVFVRTQLMRQNRKTIVSDWRMRKTGNKLRIIDLNVSGISVIVSHRESFHQHLDKKGVDGLLKLLQIRAERLPAQS